MINSTTLCIPPPHIQLSYGHDCYAASSTPINVVMDAIKTVYQHVDCPMTTKASMHYGILLQ